jgi:chromosome segregation ATPase
MHSLEQHMRDCIRNSASIDSTENLLRFPRGGAGSSQYDSTGAALRLVSQVAESIRNIQDRANESEARTKTMAEKAVEQLHLADARIQSAEEARRVAEENLYKISIRLEEAETELIRTISRIATADAQLSSAEDRLRASDMRATNAEKAFKQLEQAIHAQLVGINRGLTRQSAGAV